MSSSIELKIADVLHVAIDQLACCEEIMKYPKKYSMNFDPSFGVDNFWMNASKVFFYESLLLTANLLDKDSRTVSLFSWKEFSEIHSNWLSDIAKEFNDSGLKTIRDQVVGHVDIFNHNNRLPRQRRQGVINELLINKLSELQSELVKKFDEYTRANGSPYSLVSFFSGDIARDETKRAINGEKPRLTNNAVI
jgi:hypothetical protein